ncbi:type IV pilus modification PilV family protein [Duganella radicis]|uniref:Type II secretion system protein n=1 Tax=Duganella radicis TaxID=551988 RepID=A0A6L6PL93_9BURK|nr:prepilin-type N-terminal cleavage/methylation domain-containing protein [Duganella radicis]MTV39723.1 type II secretion system protein [Duganella radicis]
MSTKPIRRQSGLTLIELVIFMVIVGAAAAGIMGVLNIGGSSSADPVRRKQALMIAEALMEEVLLARFTYCDPSDPNAATAAAQANCSPGQQLTIGIPAGGRPYGNVANYGGAAGTPRRTFMTNGVDVDINGRPLGQNTALATMGNMALGGITTTVTLNYLDGAAGGALGPVGRTITSDANNLNALRITVRTTYGTGANDFVELDAYRTRYAPNLLP